ncbi:unnamed protein product [Somion occarium]
MGQCDFMIPPCDISFLYPDKEPGDVTVSLWVKYVDEPVEPTARHWAIVWDVPHSPHSVPTSTQAFRHLHITRERDKKGIPCDHLTNWGPMTKAVTPDDLTRSRLIPLGDIPLAGRQRLEEIASATPIRVPDGAWNNQDWVLTVLETALDEGVLPADFDLEEIKVCALSF